MSTLRLDSASLACRLLRHQALSRAAVLAQAGLTATLNLAATESLSARLVAAGGPIAEAVAWGFAAIVLVSAVDWVVNDLLPAGYNLAALARGRYISYSAIGAGYLIQAMALSGTTGAAPGAWMLLTGYVGFGLVCCWHAIVSAVDACGGDDAG